MKTEGKYEHVNPLTKLHDGEPYFFIRAQDKLAVEAVRCYSHLLADESSKHSGTNEELANRLMKDAIQILGFARRIDDWQQANPKLVKVPD